jgi:hypothetical protein
MSYSRTQLESWMKTIDVPVGSRVLDIGGAQKSVMGRVKTWGADDYKVLDLPNPHETHIPVDYEGDIQDGSLDASGNKFDIVFCLEVSEYWMRPMDALYNIRDLMVAGGTLYISFHFLYPHHNPAHDDCLRYTRTGAIKLLQQAGFGEVDVTTRFAVSGSGAGLVDFYKAEGMKMASGDPEQPINHNAVGWLIKCKKI